LQIQKKINNFRLIVVYWFEFINHVLYRNVKLKKNKMKNLLIISTFATLLFLGVSCRSKTAKTDAKSETEQAATNGYYTCPMHPEVHSDKPGNCPKCGMALVLKSVSDADTTQTDSMQMSK